MYIRKRQKLSAINLKSVWEKRYEYYGEEERQKLAQMIKFVLSSPEELIQRDIVFKGKEGSFIWMSRCRISHDPAIEGIG